MTRKYTTSGLLEVMRLRDSGMTWDKLAAKIGTSRTQAIRWHRIGLKKQAEAKEFMKEGR